MDLISKVCRQATGTNVTIRKSGVEPETLLCAPKQSFLFSICPLSLLYIFYVKVVNKLEGESVLIVCF